MFSTFQQARNFVAEHHIQMMDREMEYYAVRNRPHPYEVALYFDV